MNNENKVTIYIDESSTLGKIEREPYFIIAAIVLKDEYKKPIKNLVKNTLLKLKSIDGDVDELHATHMPFKYKQRFFTLLQRKVFDVLYLIARKDKLHKSLYKKTNITFNYFIYLLLKNILHDTTIDKIDVIIDMRSVKITSGKALQEYLQLKLIEKADYKTIISVQYGDSKNYKLLQVADLVANAIFAKYNFNKGHFYSFFKDKIAHRELFPQWWFDRR